MKLGQDLEKQETYMCSTIRLNRAGWPKELNSARAKKMKAGDVHFLQDGNMVATLRRTKDLLPSCLPMLSHGWGKQTGRLQEER